MKKIRKNNKGFTLVELISVIAIIAVLSAVAAPQYIKYVERSRQGVDASTLEEVRHAVEVEAAINPPDAATTVTVSNAGAIETPSSGGYANLAQVELITGDPVTLKSKAATKSAIVLFMVFLPFCLFNIRHCRYVPNGWMCLRTETAQAGCSSARCGTKHRTPP